MLLEFSEEEAEFSKMLMDLETKAVFAPLTTPQITQTLVNQVMTVPVGTSTLTITEAAKQFSRNKSREILKTLTDGFLEGKTTSKIASEVGKLMDNRQIKQAKTLVTTTTNAASNLTRNAFFASNTGLIEKYEWVATLDGRTTLICGGRDGNKYKIGKGPLPPAHWGCRSTVIPIVREDLLVEDEAARRPERGASGPGTVSADSTYQTWLKRQPASFQDEALGPARAKLFRQGGLEVRQFRDELGRTYSLEDLRLLYPMAFEKVNI
jgi:SPP1 gp7 family putative phage head morphogenesis protein